MGKMIDYSYKTIYELSEDIGTLNVMMEGKNINQDIFRAKANKQNVVDISIIAGFLSQNEFNNLITVIHNSTDKNIDLTFIPEIKEGEEITDAYNRYIEKYRNQIQDTPRHFPDNIFMNHTAIEIDNLKDNYKKRNHL